MRIFLLLVASFTTLIAPALALGGPRPRSGTALPAASCDGLGGHVTTDVPSNPFSRSGDLVRRRINWACGCARGRVFTLVYEPKTHPLRVRLQDQSKDACEKACVAEMEWDLGRALRDAGTKDIRFLNP
jgi:hypothetical protein